MFAVIPASQQNACFGGGVHIQPTRYEGGVSRIAVALLPTLAQALDTTVETLIGEVARRAKSSGKRGPAPKIQQQLERVSALPKAKQRVIAEVLDFMLAQAMR